MLDLAPGLQIQFEVETYPSLVWSQTLCVSFPGRAGRAGRRETRLYTPHPPPLKNPPSTDSSAPSCSTPTATMLTPCVSSVGRRRLISTAPSRQNCHPNRRMNMITASMSDHMVSMATDCVCVCVCVGGGGGGGGGGER